MRFVEQSELNGEEYARVLDEVKLVLMAGGVVVMPTDTVYGICQLVEANPAGANRLFQIKRRDRSKTVPIMVPDASWLNRCGVTIPDYARELAAKHWPGGLTLVVHASDEIPAAYRGADATVALRVPGPSVALDILRHVGKPLAVTSANTSGFTAPSSGRELEEAICEQSDLVIDGGAVGFGEASTIVSCLGPVPSVIREGAVAIG